MCNKSKRIRRKKLHKLNRILKLVKVLRPGGVPKGMSEIPLQPTLVDNPGLFLQAVESRAQESADKRLAAGPEGDWCKDLTVVAAILKRLTRQVPTLFAATQDALERERLQHAFTPTKTQFQRLEWALAQTSGDDR